MKMVENTEEGIKFEEVDDDEKEKLLNKLFSLRIENVRHVMSVVN